MRSGHGTAGKRIVLVPHIDPFDLPRLRISSAKRSRRANDTVDPLDARCGEVSTNGSSTLLAMVKRALMSRVIGLANSRHVAAPSGRCSCALIGSHRIELLRASRHRLPVALSDLAGLYMLTWIVLINSWCEQSA